MINDIITYDGTGSLICDYLTTFVTDVYKGNYYKFKSDYENGNIHLSIYIDAQQTLGTSVKIPLIVNATNAGCYVWGSAYNFDAQSMTLLQGVTLMTGIMQTSGDYAKVALLTTVNGEVTISNITSVFLSSPIMLDIYRHPII